MGGRPRNVPRLWRKFGFVASFQSRPFEVGSPPLLHGPQRGRARRALRCPGAQGPKALMCLGGGGPGPLPGAPGMVLMKWTRPYADWLS